MKSERRHELQTNSLAQALSKTPEFMRVHGAKVLLVVILLLLGAILFYNKQRKGQEQLQSGWTNIAQARQSIDQLGLIPAYIPDPVQRLAAIQEASRTANAQLTSIIGADDPKLVAEAYLLRGDLNWRLANLPPITEAATRPALKLEETSTAYLDHAKDSYQKVVRNYADHKLTAANAKFGLAAVAENRHEWDTAAKLYEEVKSDTGVIGAYQTLATARLEKLPALKKTAFILPSTQPATTQAAK